MNSALENIQKSMPGLNILVIGDLMLDEYMYGRVTGTGPDGVKFLVEDTKYFLGGAGNLVHNISTIGVKSTLFGVAGNEHALLNKLKKLGSDCTPPINMAILPMRDGTTTVKTRFIDAPDNCKMRLRVDHEDVNAVALNVLKQNNSFLETCSEQEKFSVVVLSDYNKGMFRNREFVSYYLDFLRDKTGKIIADVKPENFMYFVENSSKTADLIIKCNISELKAITEKHGKHFGFDVSDSTHMAVENTDASISKVCKKIAETFNVGLIITRSEKGMSYIDAHREIHSSTSKKDVYDVTGAGDTTTAMFAVAWGSGLSMETCLHLSNIAASIAISNFGTYSVTFDEIRKVVLGEYAKIKTLKELKHEAFKLKHEGKTIVFTNGCFDLLNHPNHIEFLKLAAKQGDHLIVAINSDESVRKLKGPGRPYINEKLRISMIAALECVDSVVLYNEATAEQLIKAINPEVYVTGENYKKKYLSGNLVEAKRVEEYGGRIHFVPLIKSKPRTNNLPGKIKC
jgi:D-beta-D-heptose 7-phosphate kinase/D-beta-D-heptose 1-phosphate adenosyltransferase